MAATSTAATAEITMRTVVEGVWRDIQAQLEQNRVDALQREQEAQQQSGGDFKTTANNLTDQLNKFQPASEHAVGVIAQEKLSDQVQQRFDAQHDRIEKLSEIVLESRKGNTNQC